MRLWEFSCKNSQQVKQWSTILQYLIEVEKKVFMLKAVDPLTQDYPTKDLLRNHFKSNGPIAEVLFIGVDKTYVIIFDNETAVEQLMLQNRLHHITTTPIGDTKSPSYSNASHAKSPSASNRSNSSNPPVPNSPSPAIANIPDKYKKKVCQYMLILCARMIIMWMLYLFCVY